jgi:release factor glutamine methyltransferase
MTAREAFSSARDQLKEACIAEPDAKAREIVAHVLGIGYADIFFCQHVDTAQLSGIAAMTKRCVLGEPVQYVTGRAYFRHLALSVTPDVLIPRKETELVAQKAIDMVREQDTAAVLDMCTGSGCIAIALATETHAQVEACDISEKALVVARRNALEHGASVRFFTSDMFSRVSREYDVIVCNPPYVSEAEYQGLSEDVRLFEPRIALTAGDGLEYYRRIAREAAQYLTEDGTLVLEIGARQGGGVSALLAQNFESIECERDYEGRERIVSARRKQGVPCLRNSTNINGNLLSSKRN